MWGRRMLDTAQLYFQRETGVSQGAKSWGLRKTNNKTFVSGSIPLGPTPQDELFSTTLLGWGSLCLEHQPEAAWTPLTCGFPPVVQ